eukprot:767137-Hanusia_phi.AAC.1
MSNLADSPQAERRRSLPAPSCVPPQGCLGGHARPRIWRSLHVQGLPLRGVHGHCNGYDNVQWSGSSPASSLILILSLVPQHRITELHGVHVHDEDGICGVDPPCPGLEYATHITPFPDGVHKAPQKRIEETKIQLQRNAPPPPPPPPPPSPP